MEEQLTTDDAVNTTIADMLEAATAAAQSMVEGVDKVPEQ